MNKQALSFLSLFSLVLLLAVYYVMLPVNHGEIILPESSDTLDVLSQTLSEKRDALIEEYSQIVASNNDETEKEAALNQLNELKQLAEKEKQITNTLTLAGYDGCFVQIDDGNIKVTCPKSIQSQENITAILRILNQSNPTNGTTELSFQ